MACTWRLSPVAEALSDILDDVQLKSVEGHGSHKRELARLASSRLSRTQRSSMASENYISAATIYAAHRCCEVTPPSAVEGDFTDDDVSVGSDLTSASGLFRSLQKRKTNSGCSARSLANSLATSLPMVGFDASTLKLKDLRDVLGTQYGIAACEKAKQVHWPCS